MKEKKIKEWFQEHKKEIKVGVMVAAGTAVFFIFKNKKPCGIRTNLSLSFRFFEGEDDLNGHNGVFSRNETYITLDKPNITIKEMGKLGELLKKKIPELTGGMKVDYLSCNYSINRPNKK